MIALIFACTIAVAYSATTMGPTDAATTMGPTDAAATTMAPAATTDAPAATTAAPAVTKILYDLRHHKAIMVRSDGCFEYHMNHQELGDAEDANRRHLLEAKMTQALASAHAIHQMGHHHIDHMSSEIKTTCASLPVYTFESHAA